MSQIEQNILQAISDFDGVKEAIISNGVDVPYDTDTKEYGKLVNQACNVQYNEGKALAQKKPFIDTSKNTDWAYFFQSNRRADWSLENTDFSNGETFAYCFQYCKRTGEVTIDAPNATDFTSTFNSTQFEKIIINNTASSSFANSFQTNALLKEIVFSTPTKNVSKFGGAFKSCTVLETIRGLDFSGVTLASGITDAFNGTKKLTNVEITGSLKVLSNNIKLSYSDNLTVESMMSFINAFEDNTGGTTYTVYFGATNLAKLTAEQQQIATNKNIILA